MEKLLRDLNIYAHSFMNCNLTFTYDGNRIIVQWDEIWPYVAESIILNKRFWFIKWLVENEKLKWTDKMEIRKIMLWMPEKQDYYIMMLAVTPQPIEFLVSILK